jgi:hypothetical protein
LNKSGGSTSHAFPFPYSEKEWGGGESAFQSDEIVLLQKGGPLQQGNIQLFKSSLIVLTFKGTRQGRTHFLCMERNKTSL